MSENPYVAPQNSQVNQGGAPSEVFLASRWSRLGASLIDGIILLFITLPLFLVVFAAMGWLDPALASDPDAYMESLAEKTSTFQGLAISFSIGVAVYVMLNGYLLVKYGQTIGKKILKIRIVNAHNYELLSFGVVVGIRYVVMNLLAQIPVVGGVFAITDSLFIFSRDKRCIHDIIAGSIVIKDY